MRFLILGTATLLAGCTLGPDFKTPEMPYQSDAFERHSIAPKPSSVTIPEPVDAAWWTVFGDPELTALEHRVTAGNLDVQTANFRLSEARSQLALANTNGLPTVNANANYTREAQSSKGVVSLLGGSGSSAATANGLGGTTGGFPSSGTSALTNPFNLYQAGFDASWEIDLWGRVRRNVESADALVTASSEAGHGVMLTAMAELARDYIQLRGIQAQMAIVKRNLDIAASSVKLTHDRFANGVTTELDVANATAQQATTASLMPNLQQQEAQLINAISLLIGEPPGTLRAELATTKPIPPAPPRIGVGIPSELTRRRPDIRQAEAQLHAATADVGVAIADFYPRFTLSASAALQAIEPRYLVDWSARTFGAGPSVTLPIFDGGKLRTTLELRKTEQQAAALQYRQTVLQALHDVDNALIAADAEQGRRAQLQIAVDQNRRAVSVAHDRYNGGIIDFLSVLIAERQLLDTEQRLNESTVTVSTNLVQLYKALGGGWDAQ